MKVLVTGSRAFTDYAMIRSAMVACKPSLVIHGGARGADKLAGRAALELGIDVKVVLPDWETFGRGAGFRRNCDMVNMEPDLVLAFFTDHPCRGTTQCVKYAKSRGISITTYSQEMILVKRWVIWASDHGDFCACPTLKEAEKWKARFEKDGHVCHIFVKNMSQDDLKFFDADNYGP